MADYESDFTQFLKQLKRERPHLDAAQQTGRAIWWDREPLDLEQARRLKDARVPQKPYPYQPES
jgi:hypothetical protein